jgi:HYDIN/CFA65/VesB-like, Ig-like domain
MVACAAMVGCGDSSGGTEGTAGGSGSGGTDGGSGSGGVSGAGGASGSGGVAGAAGTGGVAGSSGTGGAAGSAGAGGSAGASGAGGSSGTAGAAGAGGSDTGICVHPAPFVFPSPTVGGLLDAASFGSVGIENCGDTDIELTSISLSPSSSDAIHMMFDPIGGASSTLSVGELLYAEVEFWPTDLDLHTGTLEVLDLSGTSIVDIPLEGQAISDPGHCVIQVGQGFSSTGSAELFLGNAQTGESIGQTFFIANISASPCEVTAITGPTPATAFSLPYPNQVQVPISLAVTQLKQVNVDFAPTSAGTYEATMTVTSNDGLSPTRELTLRGNGY